MPERIAERLLAAELLPALSLSSACAAVGQPIASPMRTQASFQHLSEQSAASVEARPGVAALDRYIPYEGSFQAPFDASTDIPGFEAFGAR